MTELENLAQRLSSLEEEILRLLERDSQSLKDHIRYWNLQRKEQALLHYAKKKGYSRIGMTAVPSLQSSMARAREAIEMELEVTSLYQSAYAFEKWSISDVSFEKWITPPKYTFKKLGQAVELMYDDDPDNKSREVAWGAVYYKDDTNVWRRGTSGVDASGIYFTELDGFKNYYTKFEDLAAQYGSTGAYTVRVGSELIAVVISDSDTDEAAADAAAAADTAVQRAGSVSPPQTPTTEEAPSPRRGRRRRSRQQPTTAPRQQRQRRPPSGQREQRSRVRRSRGSSSCSGGQCTAPSPAQVGSRLQSTPSKGLGRVQRLLQEARDPPIILVRGGSNSLKCLRFRIRHKYSSLYVTVSTTWNWTHKQSEGYLQSRIIYLFKDENQREIFLKTVAFPPSVSWSLGSLNGI
uniref:Regulatory protein E2 n=1 Tax=Bat papillomavirus TaxID=2004707 RepID=A0A2Z2JNP7_9PAPI|nr:E2 [Bat papillomavirus]